MDLQRRRVLSLLGTVSVVTLAGCSDSDSTSDDGDTGDDSGSTSDDGDSGDDSGSTSDGGDTGSTSDDGDAGDESQQTEDDNEEDTTDPNINIVDMFGGVNSSSDGIEEVRLVVERGTDANDIDLRELSINYAGDNGSANYVYAGDDGASQYMVQDVRSKTGDGVMTDDSDRYHIVIPFENGLNLGPEVQGNDSPKVDTTEITGNLLTRQEAEIEITTESGSTLNVLLKVPETISDDSASVSL